MPANDGKTPRFATARNTPEPGAINRLFAALSPSAARFLLSTIVDAPDDPFLRAADHGEREPTSRAAAVVLVRHVDRCHSETGHLAPQWGELATALRREPDACREIGYLIAESKMLRRAFAEADAEERGARR